MSPYSQLEEREHGDDSFTHFGNRRSMNRKMSAAFRSEPKLCKGKSMRILCFMCGECPQPLLCHCLQNREIRTSVAKEVKNMTKQCKVTRLSVNQFC